MSVLRVPRALFKGKSNETPFLFFMAGAQAFIHFSSAKIKSGSLSLFNCVTEALRSETAALSKNTFKLFLTVASSASSCLYF